MQNVNPIPKPSASTTSLSSQQPHMNWKAWREQKRLENQTLQPAPDPPSIANEVPWYVISVTIMIGAALLSYGMIKTLKRWSIDLQQNSSRVRKTTVIANILAIVTSTICAGVAGLLLWNWILGAMCGFIGAWCWPWVITMLTSIISRWKNNDGRDRISKI